MLLKPSMTQCPNCGECFDANENRPGESFMNYEFKIPETEIELRKKALEKFCEEENQNLLELSLKKVVINGDGHPGYIYQATDEDGNIVERFALL